MIARVSEGDDLDVLFRDCLRREAAATRAERVWAALRERIVASRQYTWIERLACMRVGAVNSASLAPRMWPPEWRLFSCMRVAM